MTCESDNSRRKDRAEAVSKICAQMNEPGVLAVAVIE